VVKNKIEARWLTQGLESHEWRFNKLKILWSWANEPVQLKKNSPAQLSSTRDTVTRFPRRNRHRIMDKFAKRSNIDLKSKAGLDPSEILRRKVPPCQALLYYYQCGQLCFECGLLLQV
jgi:hypothetical protein